MYNSAVKRLKFKPIYYTTSRLLFSKDESESSNSLAILSCLCHDNYSVGKSFLTNLTTEERTKLYAGNHQDARSKLCLDHLLTSLNRRHFLNQPPKFENLSQNLSLLSTAFAAAYPENDLVVMRICIDFLEDIVISSAEHFPKDNVKEIVLSIIKQMFCMMDFGDVSDEQNSLLFNFTSHLSKFWVGRVGEIWFISDMQLSIGRICSEC